MRSHLFTKKLFCVVCSLEFQIIFPWLSQKVCREMQNWNESWSNWGKRERLAGWEQQCSWRMIISQGWNSHRECYKVKQAEQSEMLIRRRLKKKLAILGLEAIFLFNLLQINAWHLGCRVLFLLPSLWHIDLALLLLSGCLPFRMLLLTKSRRLFWELFFNGATAQAGKIWALAADRLGSLISHYADFPLPSKEVKNNGKSVLQHE